MARLLVDRITIEWGWGGGTALLYFLPFQASLDHIMQRENVC